MWDRIKNLWKRISSQEFLPRYSRLAGDLDSYEPQLLRRVNDAENKEAEWANQAKALLAKSRKLLNNYKIDEAWKVFHTAKRLEYFGMKDHERLAIARSLVQEVAKLNEWRREAILSLLGKTEEDITVAPAPETLIMAAELKDEYYNNQYYKNKLSRNIFSLLFSLLFMVIVGIVIFFRYHNLKYGEGLEGNLALSSYITGVLLFGFLGAVTSAILFTRYMSSSSRITEIGSSKVITFSKIFVGAAFSVFIFLLLRSSVAENIKIFSFSIEDPLDYFTVAFVSGFSERLAQKAIEAIVGKDEEEAPKAPPSSEP